MSKLHFRTTGSRCSIKFAHELPVFVGLLLPSRRTEFAPRRCTDRSSCTTLWGRHLQPRLAECRFHDSHPTCFVRLVRLEKEYASRCGLVLRRSSGRNNRRYHSRAYQSTSAACLGPSNGARESTMSVCTLVLRREVRWGTVRVGKNLGFLGKIQCVQPSPENPGCMEM